MLKWYFKTSIIYRMLGAFIIGGLIGISLWYVQSSSSTNFTVIMNDWVAPFGTILVKMLKMIVIPLIFFSLIQGASSLPIKKFGRIGLRIILLYLLTSLIAAIMGTVFALWINPGGAGFNLKTLSTAESSVVQAGAPVSAGKALTNILMSLFDNPFAALAQGNFLPVVVFAILFGLCLNVVQERGNKEFAEGIEIILKVIGALNQALFVLVEWIMEYAPIGILSLTITNFTTYGPLLAGPYLYIALGVIGGILVMTIGVYPLLCLILAKTSPVFFYKNAYSAMITAFVTRSSGATLPISLKTAIDKLKIKKELAEFSLPLGATINMDGVCIHLPMFAILAANFFALKLGFTSLLVMVITTVLAAIGAGGIPGGSLMLLFLILRTMGLGEEQIALVVGFAMGINPILDMFETMNNVTGDLMCTYIIARKEGMINSEVDSN